MKLSHRWLQDYVDTGDIPTPAFLSGLTMSGSKVDGVEEEGDLIRNVVVGKVLEVSKHPNADTLFLCKVDVGGKKALQLITAATNVTAGAFVPVALDDSSLADGKTIRGSEMRGEMSEGMLCSLDELGLTKNDFPYADPDGIFLMEEENMRIGGDIREALGLNDKIYEIDVTSNRPDCLSVIGLAREVAATFDRPISLPSPAEQASEGDHISDYLSVELREPSLCLRYAAGAVKNVRIGPSPRWMRERLRAAGMRPINNIVDITNYVMLEYGQPLHAFDLKHVRGSKIIVRTATPGEHIVTLDKMERTLSPEMLVIADAEAPSAIAGIMGGEWSGIYDDTQTVIFESACFFGPSIRTSSRKLGLRTESSSRFEKGLDPHNCPPALARACELVRLLDAGEIVDGILDVRGNLPVPAQIRLEPQWINAFLGVEIPREEMEIILKRLDFRIEGDMVTVPSYRADCEGKADLAEEVSRIYGYDKIPSTTLRGLALATLSPEQKLERQIAQTLLAQGLSEIITYSFISPKFYDSISMPQDSPLRRSVTIQNPLGEDTSVMRTTAIPSMLEILARNYNNRIPQARLYEMATIYLPLDGQKLPDERKQVMLGLYGGEEDFFSLKGIVEAVLDRCGVKNPEFIREKDNPTFHPGRCARLVVGGKEVGICGEIHPDICVRYGIGATVYLAALDFGVLQEAGNPNRSYKALPRFPASTRDLALVCDEGLPVAEIQKVLAAELGGILERLGLFDVYRGKQVGEGKKSVAYALTLRAADRTLTDEECDQAIERALQALDKLDVHLRS